MQARKKKTGLARASVYVYSFLLIVFIASQLYFESKRSNFWSDNLNMKPDVAISLYHEEIQVTYYYWMGTIAVVTILWSIAAAISKRRQRKKQAA